MEGEYVFCFFKQKTAYGMRISDWSSDVCSSDLKPHSEPRSSGPHSGPPSRPSRRWSRPATCARAARPRRAIRSKRCARAAQIGRAAGRERVCPYVSITVVAVSLTKKNTETLLYTLTHIKHTPK